MIYFFLLALTVIPLFIIEEFFQHKKYSRLLIIVLFSLSVLSLIMVSVFRHNNIGIDLNAYRYYFDTDYNRFELGYRTLSSLFKNLSEDFSLYKSFYSVSFGVLFGLFFYLISKKKWMSLLLFQTLYLYVSSFSLLRQYIAMVFVLFAVYMLKLFFEETSKKWVYYVISILLIIVGSLFHYSSLAMLILPVIALIERRYYLIILYAIGGLVLFFFREPLINYLLTSFFPTKQYYLDFQPEIGIFPVLQFSLILWNQFLYRIKSREDEFLAHEKEYLFVTNLSIVWLITIFVFSWFPNVARLTMYISLIMCAFLPNFMKYKKSTYALIIILLVAYYAFALLYRDYQGVYPYQFMWEVVG